MKFSSICLLLFVLCVAGGKSAKIIRIVAETEAQLRGIHLMNKILNYQVDYLIPIYTTDKYGDIVVSNNQEDQITTYLKNIGVKVKELSNTTMPLKRRKRSDNARIELNDVQSEYMSYTKQMKLFYQIRSDNPSFSWPDNIGSTTEGDRMMMITFGYPSSLEIEKPMLFLNCGLHAREWIASAACVNIMWKLGYEPEWRDLLEKIDISIIPNTNPDGYEYTRTEITEENKNEDVDTWRLWRKNRRNGLKGTKYERLENGTKIQADHECIGVDLNRNFPYKFNYTNKDEEIYRDENGCSIVYSGPFALSEFESRNVYNAITARIKNIKGFIDIHSYGQLILLNYSHDYNIVNENLNDLRRMADVMRESMETNKTKYTIMSTTELYPTLGSLSDTVASLGVKYSYTVELPPSEDVNYPGFYMNEERIAEVSEGFFKGIINVAKELVKEYGTNSVPAVEAEEILVEKMTIVSEVKEKEKIQNTRIEMSPLLIIIITTCMFTMLFICAKNMRVSDIK